MKKHYQRTTALFLLVLLLSCLPLTALAGNSVQDARDGVVCIALRVDAIGTNGKSFSEVVSTGTGFFIGRKNKPVQYIVTNRHVIECEEAEELRGLRGVASLELVPEIVFESYDSSSTVEATIVKKFSSQDLAILKLEIPTTERKALPLGNAESLTVTDEVYALGFPDLSNDDNSDDINAEREDITVTKGYVTKAKAVLDGDNFFQLDAKLSYGNSGGPVLTPDGRVVGIASRISFNSNYTETMGAALWVEYLTDYLDTHGIEYDNGRASVLPWILGILLLGSTAGGAYLYLLRRKALLLRRRDMTVYPAGVNPVSPTAREIVPRPAILGGTPTATVSASFNVGDSTPEAEKASEAMSSLDSF